MTQLTIIERRSQLEHDQAAKTVLDTANTALTGEEGTASIAKQMSDKIGVLDKRIERNVVFLAKHSEAESKARVLKTINDKLADLDSGDEGFPPMKEIPRGFFAGPLHHADFIELALVYEGDRQNAVQNANLAREVAAAVGETPVALVQNGEGPLIARYVRVRQPKAVKTEGTATAAEEKKEAAPKKKKED